MLFLIVSAKLTPYISAQGGKGWIFRMNTKHRIRYKIIPVYPKAFLGHHSPVRIVIPLKEYLVVI